MFKPTGNGCMGHEYLPSTCNKHRQTDTVTYYRCRSRALHIIGYGKALENSLQISKCPVSPAS